MKEFIKKKCGYIILFLLMVCCSIFFAELISSSFFNELLSKEKSTSVQEAKDFCLDQEVYVISPSKEKFNLCVKKQVFILEKSKPEGKVRLSKKYSIFSHSFFTVIGLLSSIFLLSILKRKREKG